MSVNSAIKKMCLRGPNWGDNGFIKIRIGTNECGIEQVKDIVTQVKCSVICIIKVSIERFAL